MTEPGLQAYFLFCINFKKMEKLILMAFKREEIILVFIYLGLIIFILLMILFIFSSIEIHIQNIKISSYELSKIHLNKDYKIIITLKIFNKLSFFKVNLGKTQFEEKKLLNKIEQRVIKKSDDLKNGLSKILKLIKLSKVKHLNLDVKIGIEDAAINAIIVGIISTIIPILLRNNLEESNAFWEIKPVYNQNSLKVNLDTTIS